MRVVMVGTGYVGLVSGVCFADFGHDVICVDKDPSKIETLNKGGIPIFEPGLDTLVAKNVKGRRLSFTTNLSEAMQNAEAIFIGVGTPSRRGDGHADLTYVRGIGLDKRIGRKFLHAGPGYGGSCFPKDTLALSRTAKEAGVPVTIVDTVIAANKHRKFRMADKIIETMGGDIAGKTIAILGLAFKPNTDDMRDAPSLTIIPRLQENGAKIKAYDPEAMTEASRLLEEVIYSEGVYECIKGADALVIVTEWNEFRALDMERVKQLLKEPILIDLRNIYRPESIKDWGFKYANIGRPV